MKTGRVNASRFIWFAHVALETLAICKPHKDRSNDGGSPHHVTVIESSNAWNRNMYVLCGSVAAFHSHDLHQLPNYTEHSIVHVQCTRAICVNKRDVHRNWPADHTVSVPPS